MVIARIYNDHALYGDKEYVEKFRDDEIRIGPKSYVEMDPSEASLFLGQMIPMKKKDNGDPITTKALRMVTYHRCGECQTDLPSDEKLVRHLREVHLRQAKETQVHRCPLCKEECKTESELDAHMIDRHKELPASVKRVEEKSDHRPSPRGSQK